MKLVIAILGVVAFALLASLLLSLPVMWLWNWLMPALFGLTTLTWLQAWGLSLLSSLLIKSHTSKA